MAIETSLERIATALEAIATASGLTVVRTTLEAGQLTSGAAPEVSTAPEATIETLREALREHAIAHGRDSAIEILATYKVKSATALAVEHYGAAIDLLRKPKETAE